MPSLLISILRNPTTARALQLSRITLVVEKETRVANTEQGEEIGNWNEWTLGIKMIMNFATSIDNRGSFVMTERSFTIPLATVQCRDTNQMTLSMSVTNEDFATTAMIMRTMRTDMLVNKVDQEQLARVATVPALKMMKMNSSNIEMISMIMTVDTIVIAENSLMKMMPLNRTDLQPLDTNAHFIATAAMMAIIM
jgi:hypothetical protein